MTARYRRVEPIDVLVVDGEALLLLAPDQVVRLSPLGTTLIDATTHPCSLDDLAALVEGRFGPPPVGTTVIALTEILHRMVEAGVLERLDG